MLKTTILSKNHYPIYTYNTPFGTYLIYIHLWLWVGWPILILWGPQPQKTAVYVKKIKWLGEDLEKMKVSAQGS